MRKTIVSMILWVGVGIFWIITILLSILGRDSEEK